MAYNVYTSMTDLFTRRTEDLRILDRVAHFLQDGRLSGVRPPNDENSKVRAFTSEIDGPVYADRGRRAVVAGKKAEDQMQHETEWRSLLSV
jgi:hypothetical protein